MIEISRTKRGGWVQTLDTPDSSKVGRRVRASYCPGIFGEASARNRSPWLSGSRHRTESPDFGDITSVECSATPVRCCDVVATSCCHTQLRFARCRHRDTRMSSSSMGPRTPPRVWARSIHQTTFPAKPRRRSSTAWSPRGWRRSSHVGLRYRMAFDAQLTSEILRAFLRTLFASLRRKARTICEIRDPRSCARTP